jgi:hypothetical protein
MSKAQTGGQVGSVWFIGWLFTLGFAKLGFLKAVLGLLLWPYYLGAALH